MADVSQQLIEVLEQFDVLADRATPDVAYEELDETTLQVFWREWPEVSAWAGALWRKVNADLADVASPESAERADIGGGG